MNELNNLGMKRIITGLIILCFQLQSVQAQIDTVFQRENIDFNRYLSLVSTNNLEYAAEKFNLNIAEAAIEAAKVFPDPSISFDWTEDRENSTRTGYGFESELGTTLELGGKRRARIDLATSENNLAKAMLSDYFRNLQADAALVYLEALKQNQLLKVKHDSYQTMKQLAEADSIRLLMGSIMEIDAAQSKVEAGILLNELIQAEAEWKNALLQIAFMTGLPKSDTTYFPTGSLIIPARAFNPDDLVTVAQNNRADLLAAFNNKEVSRKMLQLTKKERIIDLDMKLGIENGYVVQGNAPTATAITAGIAIPLKFSNLYKGDLNIAHFQVLQAESLYKQAELQIKTEVAQAWQLYNASCKQVSSFNNGLLGKAASVKTGKIYSYKRGETSLLEVLNAQRTYNDIQTAYYETLFNSAAALVGLEKAAGIWDLNF
jgi:cobalt-zinc-cadmium efflux system outer membrane protein